MNPNYLLRAAAVIAIMIAGCDTFALSVQHFLLCMHLMFAPCFWLHWWPQPFQDLSHQADRECNSSKSSRICCNRCTYNAGLKKEDVA